MKKLLTLAVLLCATVSQAQVSYWFSQWQRRGDAADVQDFFMWPGNNVTFSYASNHVIINSAGGGTTNYIPGFGITFNVIGPYTYEIEGAAAPAPPPAPELTGDVESGPGYGAQVATVTNVSPLGLAGQVLTATGTGITWKDLPGCVGLSITQHMTDFLIGAITNVFSNGLLVATGPYVTPGGEFLIQPAGLGYLLQPSGDRFLLP